jgi:hypothetical protein
MSCFWKHNWSDWSNTIEKRMLYEIAGAAVHGVERYQRRVCSECNKIEERML